jgi:hypothetical protein
MDLLTAIASCSLHSDLGLVLAIAITFSGGNPYAVEDASAIGNATGIDAQVPSTMSLDGKPSLPKSRADALGALERIKSNDGAPLVGLLPVPPSWAVMFGRKPAELFNPCVNVSIATARLSEFEYECGSRKRPCVLKKYAQAIGMEELELGVMAQLQGNRLSRTGTPAVVESDAMFQSPILPGSPDESKRDWGPDRVFFPKPQERASKETSNAAKKSH